MQRHGAYYDYQSPPIWCLDALFAFSTYYLQTKKNWGKTKQIYFKMDSIIYTPATPSFPLLFCHTLARVNDANHFVNYYEIFAPVFFILFASLLCHCCAAWFFLLLLVLVQFFTASSGKTQPKLNAHKNCSAIGNKVFGSATTFLTVNMQHRAGNQYFLCSFILCLLAKAWVWAAVFYSSWWHCCCWPAQSHHHHTVSH